MSTTANQGLTIDTVSDRARGVIALAGEVDLSTAPQARTAVARLRSSGCRDIVVDLRAVSFLDATGLHLLLDEQEACMRDGVAFAIVDGVRPVGRLLALAGLTDRFPRAVPPPGR
jgi:anti-sigma B factor antagonist